MLRLRTLLAAAAIAAPGAAMAQADPATSPLAAFAPADAVLTLEWQAQDDPVDTLGADLAALDWEGAGAAAVRLVGYLAQTTGDGDLADLADMLDMMSGAGAEGAHDAMHDSVREAIDEIVAQCPELEPVFEGFESHYDGSPYAVRFDGLVTLGMTRFDPMPAVTAIARFDDDLVPLLEDAREAAVTCAGREGVEVGELDQDGVRLLVIDDGGDLPVVAGNVGNVFLLGSDPAAVRGVVRRLAGADEPSLADRPLWRAGERFEAGGVGFALDLATVADLLEGFGGMLGSSDPSETVLVERGLAALRTLGGVAGRIGVAPEGLRAEWAVTVDREGGDEALADLLLCANCTVTQALLAPASSVAVGSQYLPVRELVAYVQGWLDDLGEAEGETLDLRAFARDELGLDLDAALLDWIGTQMHTVVLEATGPDLGSLLHQKRAFIVPVSSPEAARAGLEQIAAQIEPFQAELLGMLDPVSRLMDDAFDTDLSGEAAVAVRSYDYGGVRIDRLQAGPIADVGVAFVGNNLVIGTPAASVEALIDVFQGAPNIVSNRAYTAARRDVPTSVSRFGFSDSRAGARGIAELLDLFAQPAAYAAFEAQGMAGTDDGVLPIDDGVDFGPADLEGAEPTALEGGGAVDGELSETDETGFERLADFYDLGALEPGSTVTVVMTSDVVDTYLYLVDPDTSTYLDANDDAPDVTRSELTFTVEEGGAYWIEATSWSGYDTGAYALEITVAPAGGGDATDGEPEETVEPLAYAELLDLTELLPRTVGVLADHLGPSLAFTTLDGDTIYSRWTLALRW